MEHYAGVGDAFLGDYHCHVGSGPLWTDHVPSPDDLVNQSCVCDLWETPGLVLEEIPIDHIPVTQRFQLVQTNLFGDLFLIRPNASRIRFPTVVDQKRAMAAIGQAYAHWHLAARVRHDELELPVRHGAFVASVRAELPAMNATLNGRGRIDFIENRKYKSDDEDFLE